MQKDDFFCAECVGIGLVKLTIYGPNGVGRGRGSTEIILDEDDVDELIHDLEKARRMKVTISI